MFSFLEIPSDYEIVDMGPLYQSKNFEDELLILVIAKKLSDPSKLVIFPTKNPISDLYFQEFDNVEQKIDKEELSTGESLKHTEIEFYSELVNDNLYKRKLRLRIGFENWGPSFKPVPPNSMVAVKDRDYWKYNTGIEGKTFYN